MGRTGLGGADLHVTEVEAETEKKNNIIMHKDEVDDVLN
jgi:hypothetical protein